VGVHRQTEPERHALEKLLSEKGKKKGPRPNFHCTGRNPKPPGGSELAKSGGKGKDKEGNACGLGGALRHRKKKEGCQCPQHVEKEGNLATRGGERRAGKKNFCEGKRIFPGRDRQPPPARGMTGQ